MSCEAENGVLNSKIRTSAKNFWKLVPAGVRAKVQGAIPNEINKEERNLRHMGRPEPNFHNPSGFSPKWQECFSSRNNNKINRKY
jgi:hypothetical protein